MKLRDGSLRLVVLTDPDVHPGRTLLETVEAALRGGATAIQLRDKSASAREAAALALSLCVATRASGALLFVNDRIDIALQELLKVVVDLWIVDANRRLRPVDLRIHNVTKRDHAGGSVFGQR